MNAQASSPDMIVPRTNPATGAVVQYPQCSACRRFIAPAHGMKKTCQRCRIKSKKKRELVKATTQAPVEARNGTTTHPQGQSVEASARSSKPKPQLYLEDLEGEQRTRALQMIKHSLKVEVQKIPAPQQQQRKPNTTHPEYQKASLLYDAVRFASSAGGLCNFSGCHSIITSDSINHYNRAQMVVKDIRKIVKFPFKFDVPVRCVTSSTKARFTYSCTCTSSVPKTLAGTSGRKSFGATGFVQGRENANHTTPTCGGFVVITVRNDDSHPLGIPGQQIIVQIVH